MSASSFPAYQRYPVPTELPAMFAGELDSRYMDCGPALSPVGDDFVDISTVQCGVARFDGMAITSGDLQVSLSISPSLDATGRIVTMWWQAPAASASETYFITMTGTGTKEGRNFKRDWMMSVLPVATP